MVSQFRPVAREQGIRACCRGARQDYLDTLLSVLGAETLMLDRPRRTSVQYSDWLEVTFDLRSVFRCIHLPADQWVPLFHAAPSLDHTPIELKSRASSSD